VSAFGSLQEFSDLLFVPLEYEKAEMIYPAIRSLSETSFAIQIGNTFDPSERFSIYGFDPDHLLEARDGALTLDGQECHRDARASDVICSKLASNAVGAQTLPFCGGWVGHVSYEFASYLEAIPRHPAADFADLSLGFYTDGIFVDHVGHAACYFSLEQDRSDQIRAAMDEPRQARVEPFCVEGFSPSMCEAEYISQVKSLKEAISAGEIYQAVLSRRLNGHFCGDPYEGYERLKEVNPSPYQFYLEMDGRAIFGTSPEMLLSARDRRLTTHPIAGTRPIGPSHRATRRLENELRHDRKERAEHNMLVDLARNDLGRVSDYGTVDVKRYMEIQRLSHVQHLVSSVESDLSDKHKIIDAFESVFPAGTVSGAPKIRAMELLYEAEPVARGPYGGAIAAFSVNGNHDSALTIRTGMTSRERIYLQAGAGIVAHSDPMREWQETEDKLAALYSALADGVVAS